MLSRGLISGHWQKGTAAPGDFRAHSPRFQGDNVDRNLALVEALRSIAAASGISMAQLAIAWVMAQGEAQGATILPLVGSRKRTQLTEALGALAVKLTSKDLERIEAAAPKGAAAGERYAAAQMASLDSERQ